MTPFEHRMLTTLLLIAVINVARDMITALWHMAKDKGQ